MTDSTSLVRIVQAVLPAEFYNLAAQSHVAVSLEELEYNALCKPGDVIVKVDSHYYRPTEAETLLGDPTKAKAKEELGWTPKTSLQELVKEMMRETVETDYNLARKGSLVKLASFKIPDHHE